MWAIPYSVERFANKIGRFRDIGYGYHWWSAWVGDYRVNDAAGHGGQMIVLVDEFDMVLVLTAYTYYLEHNDQSWKHEKANIKLLSDFIYALPSE